ncbi:hypothetical protein HZA97_06000 [Candidatus Woesearchaeota archaeon]|nr:hypothetical protein [Candidatus Woesearchaeota archaeon]
MNKQYDQPFGIQELSDNFLFENLLIWHQGQSSFYVPKEFLNEGKVRELMTWLEEQRR